MEFCFTRVIGAVKPMMVALSTIFISLEYYFDLQYVTISFQCCNLLATSIIGVFSKWSGTFIEFSEFNEFRESEESLKHELG